MLEIKDVTYGYGSTEPVIKRVSAQVAEGRIYGLFGLNGSGKTTLLKIMSGLLFPKEGTVSCEGKAVRDRKVETLQNIAFMPSELSFKKESLERFVSLNSVFYPMFSRSVFDDCIREFGLDAGTADLDMLSLGQKHKFMLSFILSLGTKFILLDEPMNGMDVPSRSMFRRLLMRHLREDQSLVASTHVMTDVSDIITDVMVLGNDGGLFCASLAGLSEKYAFGISTSPDGALYSERCAEGYRVLVKNGQGTDSEIPLDILFNAIIKGAIENE